MNTLVMSFRLKKQELNCLSKCRVGNFFNGKCDRLNFTRLKSYYQVLGLNSTASDKDIKSAYYKLSLQYHPDRNKGCTDSVKKFHEIAEAYEVLSNPEKKRSYDQASSFKTVYSAFGGQTGYYYKPQTKNRSHGPFTGKTKDYDYDEHFRQHYEYERQRQREYEYFKRRWEADFNRRYGSKEEFMKSHKPYENEREFSYEEIARLRLSFKRGIFLLLAPLWFMLFLAFPLFDEYHNPEKFRRHGPLYYAVRDKDDDDDSNSDSGSEKYK